MLKCRHSCGQLAIELLFAKEEAIIASPFPDMDPYLEAPEIWHSHHTRLITNLADQLTSELALTYIANLETDIVIDCMDSGANGGSNGVANESTTRPH